jgi:ABC-type Fe3+/spermidine/putrescine transport system ATPase subunit
MKKFILLVAVSGTFIMCKKGEAATSSLENAISSADSTVSDASEKISEIDEKANAALDSANVKIKDFQQAGNEIKENIENTSKVVDSLSEKISSVKLESKAEKKDSAKENKIVVNVPAPKVIKETKIVYKNSPKKENPELIQQNRFIKKGTLEISVNDAETAKEIVKDEVAKYNGFIRSESVSLQNDDKKTAYLRVKVPVQKFDYLMSDLNYNLGMVENMNIETSGRDIVENTMCEIDITLYGKEGTVAEGKNPETLGAQSFAAISSGWNVITSIFLFILPLWPLFVIAGIGYYFYKKRKTTDKNL